MTIRAGDTLRDRYRLVRLLGTGAAGEVWQAKDLILGDTVAVKLLRQVAGSEQGFVKEAQILLELTHESIVRLRNIEVAAGAPYLVMECLAGPDLARLQEERGPLGAVEALWLIDQLAEGLDYAHRQRVLHRDIKPANVVLTGTPPGALGACGARAKLTDFGVGYLASPGTPAKTLVGTPFFMAPEVVRGQDQTPRLDVYSLAATVYHLCTGHPPRANPFDPEEEVVVPLRSGDTSLDEAVMAALAVSPKDRPPSAGAFRDLAHGRHAAVAGIGSPVERERGPGAWNGSRRRVLGLLLLIAVALLGVLGTRDRETAAATHELLYYTGLVNSTTGTNGDPSLLQTLSRSFAQQLESLEGIDIRSIKLPGDGSGQVKGHEIPEEVPVLEGEVISSAEGFSVHLALRKEGLEGSEILEVEDYRGSRVDVFSIAERMANDVADWTSGRVPREPERRGESYKPKRRALDHYERGVLAMNHWDAAHMKEAIDDLRLAVEVQGDEEVPQFLATLAIALTVGVFFTNEDHEEIFREAQRNSSAALALDPHNAEALRAEGYLALFDEFKPRRAALILERAVEAAPSSPDSHEFLAIAKTAQGEFEAAKRSMRRAIELDPGNDRRRLMMGWTLFHAGEFETAVRELEPLLDSDEVFKSAYRYTGHALTCLGRYTDALAMFQEFQRLSLADDEPEDRILLQIGSEVGSLHAHLGDPETARGIIDVFLAAQNNGGDNRAFDFEIALIELALGDREAALSGLERACSTRAPQLAMLHRNPILTELHGDPRFVALCNSLRREETPKDQPLDAR